LRSEAKKASKSEYFLSDICQPASTKRGR
jgi:hypothetical protein